MASSFGFDGDRTFSVDRWDPAENEEALMNFIKSRTKIDPFFKQHAEIIATPIFILLKMIALNNYYPKKMGQTF